MSHASCVLPAGLSMPSVAHRPGTGTAPDRRSLERIKARCPEQTDADDWARNDAYMSGFALYAHGYFWEAHEIWEPVWMRAPPNSRARALLGALIALANASLKLTAGRRGAARRLLDDALGRLTACPGTCMGIDAAELAESLRRFDAALGEAGQGSPNETLASLGPRPVPVVTSKPAL